MLLDKMNNTNPIFNQRWNQVCSSLLSFSEEIVWSTVMNKYYTIFQIVHCFLNKEYIILLCSKSDNLWRVIVWNLCKKTVISNGENHRQNKPKHINYHKNSYFHKFRGKGEVRITACAYGNAANAFPKKYSR